MPPELITTIAGIRRHLAKVRQSGRISSIVPTMGALHAGHGALMERARRESDYVVVTIFVNPIQFDRGEDYAAYTVDLGRDLEFCEAKERTWSLRRPQKRCIPLRPAHLSKLPESRTISAADFAPDIFGE